MSHRRASSSLGCFLLLVLLSLFASAVPKDPCKLLQRDLDQQIDDLKAWQKLDLQECYRVSGSDSDACRQLEDRHAQDLRSMRDDRAYQMAHCRGYRTQSVASASPLQSNNYEFYERYFSNRGKCVEYPYVNCQEYDHYVHAKLHHHHHHHYYSETPYGNAKSASAGAGRPASTGYQEKADKDAKQEAAATRSTAHDSPAQSAHRGTDRDDSFNRSSSRDNSPNHGSGHGNSSSAANSSHSHDSGGASHSAGSHVSGAASDSHTSSASSGPSSSGASHSSGGGGSTSPSGSSSSGAGVSSSPSPASSGASAASPASSSASSPSHDSGGSRPK